MEFVQKFVTTEVKYEFGDDSYGSDIFSNVSLSKIYKKFAKVKIKLH